MGGVVGLLLAAGCTSEPEPEPEVESITPTTTIDLGDRFLGPVGTADDDLIAVVLEDPFPNLPPAKLVRFDGEAGTVITETDLPGERSYGTMIVTDDAIYLETTEPLDDVPYRGDEEGPGSLDDPGAIVEVDPDTLQPVAQFATPPNGIHRWRIADDGTIWYTNDLLEGLFRLDPSTGEQERLNEPVKLEAKAELEIFDGHLYVFRLDDMQRRDLTTGGIVETYEYALLRGNPFARRPGMEPIIVREIAGTFWVLHEDENDPDVSYWTSFDATADIPSRQLEAQLRGRYIRSASHYWTCCHVPPGPVDADIWKRFDLGTSTVLGRYDFQDFDPMIEIGGNLWLRNTTTLGTSLGTVPLQELDIPPNTEEPDPNNPNRRLDLGF